MIIRDPQSSRSVFMRLEYGNFFFTIHEVSKSETEIVNNIDTTGIYYLQRPHIRTRQTVKVTVETAVQTSRWKWQKSG